MSDRQLRDEAVSLYIAGTDTTTSAIAFGLWKLAQHPQIINDLREELAIASFGSHTTVAELNGLKLLHGVVCEAMRMFPSGPIIPRTALDDDELAGHRIPAGSTVALDMIGLHHNPRVWPDPERFLPERFLPEAVAKRHKAAWIPFSLGQRMCLGKGLAMLEAKLALATLVSRVDLQEIPERPVKIRLSAILTTKDGVWLDAQPRAGMSSNPQP